MAEDGAATAAAAALRACTDSFGSCGGPVAPRGDGIPPLLTTFAGLADAPLPAITAAAGVVVTAAAASAALIHITASCLSSCSTESPSQ